jgi:hypothetical protein
VGAAFPAALKQNNRTRQNSFFSSSRNVRNEERPSFGESHDPHFA